MQDQPHASMNPKTVGVWEHAGCFPAITRWLIKVFVNGKTVALPCYLVSFFVFVLFRSPGAGMRGFGFVAGHGGVSAGCPLSLR